LTIGKKIKTIYIGDYKKSEVVIVIYDKESEQLARKGVQSNFSTRVECRFYIQDKKYSFEPLEKIKKYKEQAFLSTNKTFCAETVCLILNNYFSDTSIGLRSLVFLQGFTSNFTLSKTTKAKTELSPWYIDCLVTPMMIPVETFFVPWALALDKNWRSLKTAIQEDAKPKAKAPKTSRNTKKTKNEVVEPKPQVQKSLREVQESLPLVQENLPQGQESLREVQESLRECEDKLRLVQLEVEAKEQEIREKNIPLDSRKRLPALTPLKLNAKLCNLIKKDVIAYLSMENSPRKQTDFFNNFMEGNYETQPSLPYRLNFESWRRTEQWANILTDVFEKKGLSFKKWNQYAGKKG
jgi:hypothetical protein